MILHAHAVLTGARRLLGLQQHEIRAREVLLGKLKELAKLVKGSRVVTKLIDREISKLTASASEIGKYEGWVDYSKIIPLPAERPIKTRRARFHRSCRLLQ